jgi:hypothetical protein
VFGPAKRYVTDNQCGDHHNASGKAEILSYQRLLRGVADDEQQHEIEVVTWASVRRRIASVAK